MTRPRTRPPPLLLWRRGLGERRGGGGGIMVGEAWVPRVRRQDEDVDEAPQGGRLRWRERGKRRPASRLPPSRSRTWARTQRRTPPPTTRPTAPRTRRLGRSQGGWPTRARTAWRPLPSTSAPVAWGPWWTPWRRRRHCGRPPKRLLWKGPSMAETRGGGRRITRGIDGNGEGRHQKSRRRRVDNPAGPCDRVIDKLREGEVVVWRRGWLVGGETVVARVAEDDLDSSKQNFRMQLPGIKHTFYSREMIHQNSDVVHAVGAAVPAVLGFKKQKFMKLCSNFCGSLADAFSELSWTDGQTLVRDLQERKGKTL
uniref:Uncharacterized protein n=1 Tax=Oryza rufipogon TaxID=4529 RepID=A0A0E0MZG1_ORYRU